MSRLSIKFLFALIICGATAQAKTKSLNADSADHRSWWDLRHYRISLTPNLEAKTIKGVNQVRFKALKANKILQLDLQQPMRITGVSMEAKPLPFARTSDETYQIIFAKALTTGKAYTISVNFEGKPKEADDPTIDNGWVWTKDKQGRPWVSIFCEGIGASVWLPCKEGLKDEPDEGTSMAITVPDTLVAVANGRLKGKVSQNGLSTYTWAVTAPINSYNIIPYIGKYVTWHVPYAGEAGKLDRDYWVLDYNQAKGKRHFMQVDTMLKAFEYWLGPYPFYADSYKLVESPIPGMEHQSAVAYGNGFQNGYQGKDFISRSGWGLKWDFMMVHESGHEWFGNSITASTYGDTWIHEGFTKYLETLYTDYAFGTKAGNEYAIGTWKRIKNDQPILGTNTSDKYYKGSAMLHMIRQIVGDTTFRQWLRGLGKQYYHQTVNTAQVFGLLKRYTDRDLSKIFDQYLRTTQIPILSYTHKDGQLRYRWINCVPGFNMPVRVSIGDAPQQWLKPTTEWTTISAPSGVVKADTNFLINVAPTP
ncbi:M1 family metallopeptidase [Mucilaginibacter daejeonensis]|uniref:M1 family metallopeptidase n=1 Tax=Mucilaginibacter daejeonensis TaxID=398049 RepID=UPI001D175257|nr:M1 family metallopeptidase [Mucilaginibacter daejeonensis]UEG53933.1 M1 family metallopeptidase [Mucilaginibacter daejeonensis]